MTAITGVVSVTEVVSYKTPKTRVVISDVHLGDGSLTYPSGGVPCSKATLGCPGAIYAVSVLNTVATDTTMWLWEYDLANEKFIAYKARDTSGTTGGDILETATSATPHVTLRVRVEGY